ELTVNAAAHILSRWPEAFLRIERTRVNAQVQRDLRYPDTPWKELVATAIREKDAKLPEARSQRRTHMAGMVASEWVSEAVVCSKLGITRSRLARIIQAGKLTPVLEDQGRRVVRWFTVENVSRFQREFEESRRFCSINRLAKQLSVEPSVVREFITE